MTSNGFAPKLSSQPRHQQLTKRTLDLGEGDDDDNNKKYHKRRRKFATNEDRGYSEDEDDGDVSGGRGRVEMIGEMSHGKIRTLKTGDGLYDEKDKGPMVIPLIKKTQWRTAPVESEADTTTNGGLSIDTNENRDNRGQEEKEDEEEEEKEKEKEAEMDVDKVVSDQDAIRALEREAAGEAGAAGARNLAIAPMLAMNAVPGIEQFEDETEKYRHDVNMRPEEPSLEVYDNVPIEEFGAALLRGMGWSEGRPIGRNKKYAMIEPKVFEPRPQLLGLGAKPLPPELGDKKKKKYIKPGESRDSPSFTKPELGQTRTSSSSSVSSSRERGREYAEKGDVQVGDYVMILYGDYKGKEGKVVELKNKSKGLVAYIELRDLDKEIKMYSDEVKTISLSGKKSGRPSSALAEEDREEYVAPKTPWLRPHLRVRVISKRLKSGSLYKKKGVVVDVVRSGECILEMDDSREVIEGVYQKYLETVIPSTGSHVVVVLHPDRYLVGKRGKILEKSRSKDECMVQLEEDYEVLTLEYDQICQVLER